MESQKKRNLSTEGVTSKHERNMEEVEEGNKRKRKEDEDPKVAERIRKEDEDYKKRMVQARHQGYLDYIFECKKALYVMMHNTEKNIDYQEFRDGVLELDKELKSMAKTTNKMEKQILRNMTKLGEQCKEKSLTFLSERFKVKATIADLLKEQEEERKGGPGKERDSNQEPVGESNIEGGTNSAEGETLAKATKEQRPYEANERKKQAKRSNKRQADQVLGSSLPTNLQEGPRMQFGAFRSMQNLNGKQGYGSEDQLSDSSSAGSKNKEQGKRRIEKLNGFSPGKPYNNHQQGSTKESALQKGRNPNYKGKNYDPNYSDRNRNYWRLERSEKNEKAQPHYTPEFRGNSESGSWSGSGSTNRNKPTRMNELRQRFDQAKEQTRTIKKQHQEEVMFPSGWEIPTAEEFKGKGYLKIDFTRDIEKHLIKPFSGYVEDYFRFRETFYKCIHVQPVATFYKVMALDRLITNPKTQAMLSDLGTSDQAYADRIQRLEEAFGDEDKYQNHLMNSLTELRQFSANDEVAVARFGNLLRTYLNMASPLEAANIPLRQLLKTRWPKEWAKDYGMYRARTGKTDDLITLCEFAIEAHETLQKSKEDLKFEKELRATYQGKVGSSNSTKKIEDNCQVKNMIWEPAEKANEAGSYYEQETEYVEGIKEYAFHTYNKNPGDNQKKECWWCEIWDHDIHDCEKFYTSSTQERRDATWKKKVCFVCLLVGHGSRQCWSKVRCKFPKCGERHHWMLHSKDEQEQTKKKPPTKEVPKIKRTLNNKEGQEQTEKKSPPKEVPKIKKNNGKTEEKTKAEVKESAVAETKLILTEVYDEPEYEEQHIHTEPSTESKYDAYNVMCEYEGTEYYEVDGVIFAKTANGRTEVAITILAVEVTNEKTGRKEHINVLIDAGANGNALDLAVAKALGLTGTQKPYLVKAAGGGYKTHKAFEADVTIKGLSEDCLQNEHRISVQCYEQPCNIKGIDWKYLHEKWPFLKNLHLPQLHNGGRVDMIIGNKDIELTVPSKIIRSKDARGPIAQLTELGWVVAGNTGIPKGERTEVNSLCREPDSKVHKEEEPNNERLLNSQATPRRTLNDIKAAGTGDFNERELVCLQTVESQPNERNERKTHQRKNRKRKTKKNRRKVRKKKIKHEKCSRKVHHPSRNNTMKDKLRKSERIEQKKQTRTTAMINKSSTASFTSPLKGGSIKNEEHLDVEKSSREKEIGWIKKEATKWQ